MIKRYLRHPVVRNALSLYGVQAAEYVLPLITVPYLARVLEPEGWGLVVFAQSFAAWVALALEYGFNLSATREIARHRDQPDEMARIASGVTGAVLLLGIVSAGGAVAALAAVETFRMHPGYLALAWLIGVTLALRPLWYFQGTEQLWRPAWINLCARVLTAGAIFLWVSSAGDGWKVLVLQLAATAAVSALTLGAMMRELPFLRPGWRLTREALHMGWSLFLFRGAASLYTTANAFVLGLFAAPTQVAYFGSAERLQHAVLAGLYPISQVLYPRITHLVASDRDRAARVARLGLAIMGGLGLGLALSVAAFAPLAVQLVFGDRYRDSIPVLRVLALTMPLAAVSNVIGLQWMLPLGMDRAFNRVIIGAGALNLALAAWLAPRWGPLGMAWATVAAQAFVTVAMSWVLAQSGRGFWRTTR